MVAIARIPRKTQAPLAPLRKHFAAPSLDQLLGPTACGMTPPEDPVAHLCIRVGDSA